MTFLLSGILFLFWFACVGQFSRTESLVGLASCLLATVGFKVATARQPLHFRPAPRWFLETVQLPRLIIEGCAVLVQRFMQQITRRHPPQGLFLAVPFHVGGNDARSAARRALAVFYTSLPPNFVIIDIDAKTELMLFHQVRKDPVPGVTRRLGARA